MTTVTDYSLLECRFRNLFGRMVLDLKVGTQWTLTDDNIQDNITAGSSISEVAARFEPQSGDEHRMRFQVDGTWGAWSSWTTGQISQDIDVPGAGLEETVDYDVEMRPTSGTGTVAMSGYLKVKKLNSGD
ncbi:MAG: hypothetical protein AAGF11_51215 [Myxococcota bacterium]